jgi:hypothetical protein
MDQAAFVSREFSRRRRKPEKLAEGLPWGGSRNAEDAIYAARLLDDSVIAFTREPPDRRTVEFLLSAGCEPQRVPTEHIGLTG